MMTMIYESDAKVRAETRCLVGWMFGRLRQVMKLCINNLIKIESREKIFIVLETKFCYT